MSTVLQVYVSQTCWGREEARKIADAMRVEFPDVRVEVVERESTEEWPDAAIATPAYLLNGKLTSLGNPTREHLREVLQAAKDRPPAPAD